MINKKSKIIPILSYLYLLIPNILFFFGWVRWYYTLVFCILVVLGSIYVFKKIKPIDTPYPKTNRDYLIFFFAIAFLLFITLVSGVSNNGIQTDDLYVRDTIFTELINKPWPASLTLDDGSVRYMVYYIGFFLPAALVGKVFGVYIGYAFLGMWVFIGLFLVYLLFCSYFKKIVLLPIVIFVLFSGVSLILRLLTLSNVNITNYISGNFVFGYFEQADWIMIGGKNYALISHTAQIFWTFNQCMPVFVLLSLVFLGGCDNDIVFLTGSIVISSTLSCFGIAVIIVGLLFLRKEGESLEYHFIRNRNELWLNIRKYILNPTVLLGFYIAIFTGLYAIGNGNVSQTAGGEAASKLFEYSNPFSSIETTIAFLLLIIVDLGVFFAYCFKYHKKNILMYISIVTAILFLPVIINKRPDFMLKATTPFYLLISLFFIDSLKKDIKEENKYRTVIGIGIFIACLSTSMLEIVRMITGSFNLYNYNGIRNIAFGVFAGIYSILFISFVCLYFFDLLSIKLHSLKRIACFCGSFIMIIILISIITNNGMNATIWNPVTDGNALYTQTNFSGGSNSLFFSYLSR